MKQQQLFLALIVVVFLCQVQEIISKECKCPEKTAYNKISNQCTPYPSPNSPDYVVGCEEYEWIRNGTVLKCIQCNGQYYEEGSRQLKCIDSGIQHCIYVYREYIPTNVQDRISNRFLSQNFNSYRYLCSECDKGYFVVNGQQCATYPQIGDSSYVDNCSHYELTENKIVCAACEGEYYAKNGKCVGYPSQKNNCIDFRWNKRTQQAECNYCEQGYTEVDSICQQNPNIQGCSSFYYDNQQQIIRCNRCQTSQGYIFNQESSKCDLVSDLIDNCVQGSYDSYQKATCLKCRDGFYSTHDACVQNPQSQNPLYIPHCKWYKQYFEGQLLCVECNENYVAKENQCYPITQVAHCQKYYYSTSTNQSKCSSCQSGFISIDGDCQQCPNN